MNNLSKINSMIVSPFYNMLCAGEEKKQKYIGAKTLDAGDIMATISGWTVIGYGRSDIARGFSLAQKRDFHVKISENYKGIQAMDSAIGDLSLACNPADAGRALYLLTAPVKEMNMDMVKELGDYVRDLCPQATIRSGDYPREKGNLDITLILSELKEVEKVRRYFERSIRYVPEIKKRREEIAISLKSLEDASKEVPALLS
jgi:hypothetical protein